MFLEFTQIAALRNKPDELNNLEQILRDFKFQYFQILEKDLGARVARLELQLLNCLLIR